MREKIKAGLVAAIDPKLTKDMLDAYEEAKRNFHHGGHRLSAVEGGRFCEASFRILQQITTGSYCALNRPIDTEKLTIQLANIPVGTHPDSIRLYIPRALRVIYDIRNNRDAAHLADGIDPNLQDSTIVICVLDWVLAEFVRLYHNVSADVAQEMISTIVTRTAPIVEDFDGFLKVLNPKLQVSEYCLVLLYHRSSLGATSERIREWVQPKMRLNLARTLRRLVDDRALVHFDSERYFITRAGIVYVEQQRLLKE